MKGQGTEYERTEKPDFQDSPINTLEAISDYTTSTSPLLFNQVFEFTRPVFTNENSK